MLELRTVNLADALAVYELKQKLGEGSFGKVFSATHLSSKHVVAIKIVKDITDEIVKEISFMIQMKSAYVVEFIDAFIVQDPKEVYNGIWIIMEFCEFGSLTDTMKRADRGLRPDEIAPVMFSTLKALEGLHNRRVIHRDIKASNICVCADGSVKVADFGVSAQMENSQRKRNTQIGSTYWMSPEILNNKAHDTKTDIWSLGITAIELMERFPPLHRVHPFRAVVLLKDAPIQGPDDVSKYPEDLLDFIKICLTIDPAERPNASELLKHRFIINRVHQQQQTANAEQQQELNKAQNTQQQQQVQFQNDNFHASNSLPSAGQLNDLLSQLGLSVSSLDKSIADSLAAAAVQQKNKGNSSSNNNNNPSRPGGILYHYMGNDEASAQQNNNPHAFQQNQHNSMAAFVSMMSNTREDDDVASITARMLTRRLPTQNDMNNSNLNTVYPNQPQQQIYLPPQHQTQQQQQLQQPQQPSHYGGIGSNSPSMNSSSQFDGTALLNSAAHNYNNETEINNNNNASLAYSKQQQQYNVPPSSSSHHQQQQQPTHSSESSHTQMNKINMGGGASNHMLHSSSSSSSSSPLTNPVLGNHLLGNSTSVNKTLSINSGKDEAPPPPFTLTAGSNNNHNYNSVAQSQQQQYGLDDNSNVNNSGGYLSYSESGSIIIPINGKSNNNNTEEFPKPPLSTPSSFNSNNNSLRQQTTTIPLSSSSGRDSSTFTNNTIVAMNNEANSNMQNLSSVKVSSNVSSTNVSGGNSNLRQLLAGLLDAPDDDGANLIDNVLKSTTKYSYSSNAHSSNQNMMHTYNNINNIHNNNLGTFNYGGTAQYFGNTVEFVGDQMNNGSGGINNMNNNHQFMGMFNNNFNRQPQQINQNQSLNGESLSDFSLVNGNAPSLVSHPPGISAIDPADHLVMDSQYATVVNDNNNRIR